MNTRVMRAAVGFVLIFVSTLTWGQSEPQSITIPLSRPGEPIMLDVSILSAQIEVIGEDRQDAQFEFTVQQTSRKIVTPSGTKSVPGGSFTLDIEEDDNHIDVDADWRTESLILKARIPRRADLELSTTNNGVITVSNITGNLQLDNTNGPITATNITGSVIAESVNDDVEVSFTEITLNDPMALSSVNGHLRLGLPDDAGVELHIDTARGAIYSDFEVDVQPSKPTIERTEHSNGIEVRVENALVAKVNGGGTVIRMKTLNGDIHITKSN